VRFLADQDVWAYTLRTLREWGHDVIPAADAGLARAPDSELLEEAHERDRILVTRDRDFGHLVFVGEKTDGVLLLRVTPATQEAVHEELARMLKGHTFSELNRAFVVVEPGQYRIRRPE
jgi:predicted nuclease of predicted toxin-antitoxin system